MTPARSDARPAGAWDRLRLALLVGFLLLVFLGGGASRLDVASLLYLRPAAVVAAAILLLVPGPFDWARVRTPLLFLGALAAIMLVQLIPLPPGLWTSLSGHERFAEAAAAAGLPQPWRPISIAPDLTLNSLVALIVPLTVLIGMAALPGPGADRMLILFLFGAVVASAVLGIAQMTGGAGSGLYFYAITNEGMPVGFFSNRNHQAALLACGFPILAAWAATRTGDPRSDTARRWVAGAVGALFIPLIVVTGSRAGVVLALAGLAAAAIIFRISRSRDAAPAQGWRRALAWAPWAIGLVLCGASLVLARTSAVQRFFSASVGEDQRVESFSLFTEMATDFFPFGSGFGTFDPLFRSYEPYEHLRMFYLNHAHNDAIELIITSGLFGLLLVLAVLVWLAARAVALLRERPRSEVGAMKVVGAAILVILLAASIVDYPLRTPIMMALAAIAATWLAAPAPRRPAAAEA